MFKRISFTLILVFVIALLAVHIEKLILGQQRILSRQHFQRDILEAEEARLKAEYERLRSPNRWKEGQSRLSSASPGERR